MKKISDIINLLNIDLDNIKNVGLLSKNHHLQQN